MDAATAGEPLLLHGVTGSGKTEVYLRAVAAALERGRSAIVLVPEIALTPQTAGRFVERFGDAVAVMHSRLTARERYDEWCAHAPRRGARVRGTALGRVRAVCRPGADRGRRGARLVLQAGGRPALRRPRAWPSAAPREEGAVLLAGSATPRPEASSAMTACGCPSAWTAAAAAGRARGDARRRRARSTSAPAWRSTRSAAAARRRSCCSTGAAGRTSSPAVPAGASGSARTATSRWCSTAPPARSRATTAGTASAVPGACRDCGSVSVARHGAGTEQLERELGELCAPLPVFRLDADAPAAGGSGAALSRFDAAPAGLLVGTQMVAKGHDFPDVTLGVVLDADATLRFPDFRAEERTFALVAQLAGPQRPRAARRPRDRAGARPGRARAAPRRRARRRRVPGGRARAARGARLPALRAPDPLGLLLGGGGARAGRGGGRARARGRGRGSCARPGAALPAPAGATAPSWWSARPSACRRSWPFARRSTSVAADARARIGVAFAVDVDPQ